jgi:hypothetical protein
MVKKTSARVSVQRVDFQSNPGAAKEYGAWRYPKGIVARAPTTRINGKNYYDPKPGLAGERNLGRRKHESTFLITVNPNLAPRDGQDVVHVSEALKKTMAVMGSELGLKQVLKFGPKDAYYANDRYEDVITAVDWKTGVEVGPKVKRVHAHAWLTIHHISQIQLDTKAMMYLSKHTYNTEYKNLGGTKFKMNKQPYIHVKLLPQSGWADIVKQYLHKDNPSIEF